MNVFPALAILNKSTVLSDAQVQHAIPAFQHQVTYDFKPHWGVGAKILFIPKALKVPPNCWQIWIEDDSDTAGALGYHEVTNEGLPLSRVFAKTDAHYGLSWTVTATHEILEMLADPWATTAMQTGRYTFHALEVGDPVEADQYAYKGLNDILVTDFILPYWFQPQMVGKNYDFCGKLTKPLQLLNGGYVSYYDVKQAKWVQKQMLQGKLADTPKKSAKGEWRRPRVSVEMRQHAA